MSKAKFRDVLRPRRIGYLGPRTLAAFLAVGALGIALYVAGLLTASTTAKGVGVLFLFWGFVCTVGLLVRWLILREIG
jgi:hypothetical protein